MGGRASSSLFLPGLVLGGFLGLLAASVMRPFGQAFPFIRGQRRSPVRRLSIVYPGEGRIYWENGIEVMDLTPSVTALTVPTGSRCGADETVWEADTDDARYGALALEGRLFSEEGADLEVDSQRLAA